MFQNSAVDVVIGLVMMYLALSLLCTIVNEFIATKLKLRAKSLGSALEKLLDDPQLRQRFYNHGLIVGAARATATGSQTTLAAVHNGAGSLMTMITRTSDPVPGKGDKDASASMSTAATAAQKPEIRHPSYLSSTTVADALIATLDPSKPMPGFEDVKNAVKALPDACIVRDALCAAITEAQGDLDKFRTAVAQWFDESMDRLSGAYKRQLKWISMLVAIGLTIAFNANSVTVARTLWNDADRRASVVQAATKMTQDPRPGSSDSVSGEQLERNIRQTEEKLRSLPMGWHCESAATPAAVWNCVSPNLALSLFGWCLTAAALTLGAPFWFDILSKVISVRAAGPKPARATSPATEG